MLGRLVALLSIRRLPCCFLCRKNHIVCPDQSFSHKLCHTLEEYQPRSWISFSLIRDRNAVGPRLSAWLEKPGLHSGRPISGAAQSSPGELGLGHPLIIEGHLPIHHQVEGPDYHPYLPRERRELLPQA